MKRLNLALQGGGSYGAFTWGVLDRLLESGQLDISAVSGASAGAINAVVLTHGLVSRSSTPGDRFERARAALADFWNAISAIPLPSLPAGMSASLPAGMAASLMSAGSALSGLIPSAAPAGGTVHSWFDPAAALKFSETLQQNVSGLAGFGKAPSPPAPDGSSLSAWLAMLRHLSPQQFNPLNINPLRDILDQQIDFELIRREKPYPLLIAATRADTGRLRIFREHEVTADVILASTCLPDLYHTVIIDGHPYWDGGLAANPPLLALRRLRLSSDTLLVLLQPSALGALPNTADQTRDRLVQIAFRTALFAELQVCALQVDGPDAPAYLHAIEAGRLVSGFPPGSHLNTTPAFIDSLFKAGRAHADAWLNDHGDEVGQRDSMDLSAWLPDDGAATLQS